MGGYFRGQVCITDIKNFFNLRSRHANEII